jgi:hypothetical protein
MNRGRPFLLQQPAGWNLLGTRRGRTAASALIPLTILLALAHPAAAGDQVPFKGSMIDMATGAVPLPDGGVHLTNAAAGQATQLGDFTRVGSGDIHPDGTSNFTLVWTAANGDQLISDVEVASFTGDTITGTYRFTGGTGRFENATGAVDFAGVTTDGVHYDVTFNGTLSSPGASRK